MSKKEKTIKLLKKKLKKAEVEIKKLKSGKTKASSKKIAKATEKTDARKAGKTMTKAKDKKPVAGIPSVAIKPERPAAERVKTVANEPIAPGIRAGAVE